MAKKSLQHLPLFIGEIRRVVEFVQMSHVAEHLVGRGSILIHIIKIGQHQLSPSIKAVERLGRSRALTVDTMKVGHELDVIGHSSATILAKKLPDGLVGRTPQRALTLAGQMLVEKERGAFVGKHHHKACQVVAMLGQQIGGNSF